MCQLSIHWCCSCLLYSVCDCEGEVTETALTRMVFCWNHQAASKISKNAARPRGPGVRNRLITSVLEFTVWNTQQFQILIPPAFWSNNQEARGLEFSLQVFKSLKEINITLPFVRLWLRIGPELRSLSWREPSKENAKVNRLDSPGNTTVQCKTSYAKLLTIQMIWHCYVFIV